MKHRPWTGYLLAAIGVVVLLAEVGMHFYGYFHGIDYELNHPVLYVAMIIGFVGFYMINPKGAEGGSNILTRDITEIISVIRTGRRSTDSFAVVIPPTEVPPVTPTKMDDESGK